MVNAYRNEQRYTCGMCYNDGLLWQQMQQRRRSGDGDGDENHGDDDDEDEEGGNGKNHI